MKNKQYTLYNDIEHIEYLLSIIKEEAIIQDLHIHTNNSDGLFSLKYNCEKIQNSPIEMFCITDHNYLLNSVLDCQYETGKGFIYGTELSCVYKGVRIHILGYFLNTDNPFTRTVIDKIYKGHMEREKIRIYNMQHEAGIQLTYEKYYEKNKGKVPNWKRIAEALVDAGDAENIQDASEKYLRKGKSGYLSYRSDWPKVKAEDAVDAIRKDGGIPVIAHLGDLLEELGEETVLNFLGSLKECGLVGYDLSHGGKHKHICGKMQEVFEKEVGLYPFYGTDVHNASFQSNNSRTSIRWFGILLAKYSNKYLSQFQKYKLIDLIQTSMIPDYNFGNLPCGYINKLEDEGIIYFKDLVDNMLCRGADYNRIILAMILIISCLAFKVSENAVLNMFLAGKNSGIDSEKLRGEIENVVSVYEDKLRKQILNSKERKYFIRIWIPLLYRLNLYDRGSKILNESLNCKCFKTYMKFCDEMDVFLKHNSVSMQNAQKYIMKILDNMEKQEFTKNIINREFKSYASCYQKYIKWYLLGQNPKIPMGENGVRNAESKFFDIFEDLYAATIITKWKINKREFLNVFKENNITYKIRYESETSRRWYHQRIIFLFQFDRVIIEVLVKTYREYWFAYYYYWKTKNYFVFDVSSRRLQEKVEKGEVMGTEKIYRFAIQELWENIGEDKNGTKCRN